MNYLCSLQSVGAHLMRHIRDEMKEDTKFKQI